MVVGSRGEGEEGSTGMEYMKESHTHTTEPEQHEEERVGRERNIAKTQRTRS